MRVIKRFLTRHIGELRNAPRRRTIAAALQTHFALVAPPVLVQSGSRGQDSIYRVQQGDITLGMLRVVNPFRKRKLPPADMPFISVPPAARVAREMQAYETGAAAGLTPQPVWHAPDALCCAYLPLAPLHGRFMQQHGHLYCRSRLRCAGCMRWALCMRTCRWPIRGRMMRCRRLPLSISNMHRRRMYLRVRRGCMTIYVLSKVRGNSSRHPRRPCRSSGLA